MKKLSKLSILEFWLLLALQTIITSPAIAESGLHYSRTLTFADVDPTTSPSVGFQVPNGLPAGRITEIIIEVGADDSVSPLVNPLATTVGFNLTLGSESTGIITPTLPTGDPATTPIICATSPGSCVTNKTIIINRDTSTLPYLKFVFKITILHDTGTSALENWTLAISNLPTSADTPSARTNAAAIGFATFNNLVPTGPSACPVCPGGSSNIYTTVTAPTSGPFSFTATTVTENGDPLPTGTTIEAIAEGYAASNGSISIPGGPGPKSADSDLVVTYTPPATAPCCEVVTFRFDIKNASGTLISQTRQFRRLHGSCGCACPVCPPPRGYVEYVPMPWCLKCPLPDLPPWGPVCLSCPPFFFDPVPDIYERAIVTTLPMDQSGNPIVLDGEEKFTAEIINGETIGEVFQHEDGSLMQLVQFKAADEPEIVFKGGEYASQAIRVTTKRQVIAEDRRIEFMLGALLFLSIAINLFFGFRQLTRQRTQG